MVTISAVSGTSLNLIPEGAAGWQRLRDMPACLIKDEYGVYAWRRAVCDRFAMQGQRLGGTGR
jgi:hypothetical protein